MIQQSTNSLDETESVSKQPQHQHHISPMNQLQSPNKEEAGKSQVKLTTSSSIYLRQLKTCRPQIDVAN